MHVVVVGCGRVGSGLATAVEAAGHTVAIIDRKETAFRRLPAGFAGKKIVGVGFDRDRLKDAGIEEAGAVAAVTNGDNSNIMIARVAKETFAIESVVARIYDPRRAAIYERLGISTVASAQLTTELAIRWVLPDDAGVRWVEPSGNLCVVDRTVPPTLAGRAITEIERTGQVRVVAVRRLGAGIVATPDLVFQDGDVVYLAVANDQLDTVDELLNSDHTSTAHKAGH